MSDRVLRPRLRNGPSSLSSFSEEKEKVKFSSARRRQKEVVATQNLLNTVAQDRFKHSSQHSFKKRVVFSSTLSSSDDLANGRVQVAVPLAASTPVVGILKVLPLPPSESRDDGAAADRAPAPAESATRKSRSRRQQSPRRGRAGRVSKHASFTEEVRASPWTSASQSVLAALALSLSPVARKRAKQAERVASGDETVRRAVGFYKSSGEWWNVFPKTDYTYSPLSRFRREISPGVMTLPNMSRPSLHNVNSWREELWREELTPKLSYDAFHSDSDEVDDSRPVLNKVRRTLIQHESFSAQRTTSNIMWRTLISVFTFVSTILRSIVDRSSSLIHRKRNSTFVPRPTRYHTYNRHRESKFSQTWSYVTELCSVNYRRVRHMLLNQDSSDPTARSSPKRKDYPWLILLLLGLAPFLAFGGWWFFEDTMSSVTQSLLHTGETAWSGVWAILSYPFVVLQLIVSQLWTFTEYVITLPFTMLPYFETVGAVVTDIAMSPLRLLQSVLDLLFSFCGSFVSLVYMLLNIPLGFEASTGKDVPIQSSTEMRPGVLMSSEPQAIVIQDMLNAALIRQEQSFLAKMSDVRAEVVYLRDQVRHLRSRFVSCCRLPQTDNTDKIKAKIWEDLKGLFSSPEGLVLLGAAAAHSSSSDQTPSNVPHFNETEIRTWISSAFLEKDDFETFIANLTKSFHEEFERRSASLLAASSDEINARLAQQSQLHMAQLSKLKSEFSDINQFRNDPLHAGPAAPLVGTSVSFDESRVRRIVDTAIALYDADKTGMADYALESQGGEVVSTRCTETYQAKSPSLSVFGVPLWYPSNSPRTVIQPGMHPGECWAFVGSQGFLVIQLSHRIRVKGFTYEHISPVLLPTGKMDSAPKDFSVYGLRSEGDNDPILLGNYHYLQNGTSMQYFSVQRAGVQPLQLIEIQVKSNHGNINYTCMYRLRVHGSIA